MDMKTAINFRHSVRQFTGEPLKQDVVDALNGRIVEINRETGLNIKLVQNEPKTFKSFMAHVGGFKNADNYLVMAAPKGAEFLELVGYYGEELVLMAQTMGVNSCWVGGTYKLKDKDKYLEGKDTVPVVIALGYGVTQGNLHRSKPFETLSATPQEGAPDWYVEGVRAAMAAPTAMNQQKFQLKLKDGNKVALKAKGKDMVLVDKGIVKFNFEIGAGVQNFIWA